MILIVFDGPYVRAISLGNMSAYDPPPKTRFRRIKEGNGGTFAFRLPTPDDTARCPLDREVIWRIGTKGLKTCVGVYFDLPNDRCFLAHINAYVLINEERGDRLYDCNEKGGAGIKEGVLDGLLTEAQNAGWNPDDDIIKETIVVACPEPEKDGDVDEEQVGWWVMEAIKSFLGISGLRFKRKAGFIVDRYHTAATVWLTYDAERAKKLEEPPEMERYHDELEVDAATTWYFSVKPERQMGAEQSNRGDRKDEE